MKHSHSNPTLRLIATGVCSWLLLGHTALRAESILKSPHNLSANSTATVRAETEDQVCIFCHTPHRGSREAPLWNHLSSGTTYTPYSSTTTKALIGQPNGASKVCLSCHDGTVALGSVHSRSKPVAMRDKVVNMPQGKSLLGTDLSDDHPISFMYDASLKAQNAQLADPKTLVKKVKLDHFNQMQCTSCHNPHDNQYGKFLVQDNTGSALCLNCHQQTSWSTSSHAVSKKTWNGVGVNPWPHTAWKTVAENGCENCHAPHNAGGKQRLMNYAVDEQNCYSCHNGNVAAKNITADFNKPSAHPIALSRGVHDEAENPLTAARHVQCADCHNPHATSATTAGKTVVAGGGPQLSRAIAGVKGVSAAGTVVGRIASEDELCYRCHSDSSSRAQAKVARQFAQTNTRLQFSPGNASFHPVQSQGRNPNVPSLILPWRTTSRMQCTDCHNSDQSPAAGGGGANGPHGSAFAPLLERQLVLTDFSPESAANYALCYKCHSRDSLLSDQSFKGHRMHIVEQQTACTTCHDSHGVGAQPNLVNFNRAYVTPSPSNKRLDFIKTGVFSGNCSLTCHGHDHAAAAYSPYLVNSTPSTPVPAPLARKH